MTAGTMKGYFIYVPLDVAATPIDGEALCNRWWAVHPEHGVSFYYNASYGHVDDPSPQCNTAKTTAKLLAGKIQPECEVMQIPVVFMTHARKAMLKHKANRSSSTLP